MKVVAFFKSEGNANVAGEKICFLKLDFWLINQGHPCRSGMLEVLKIDVVGILSDIHLP